LSIGAELAGGLIGTLVLTTTMRAAAELRLTRMDFGLLLGTAVTHNRRKARAVGYAMHLALGLAFAFAYSALFQAIGWSSWWLGALFGAVHATFLATVVVNVLLPVVHPFMGTPETAANELALLEPPGFLMLNYGRNTFPITLVAHMAYGAIIGWAVRI
jgi:hypothetical protein